MPINKKITVLDFTKSLEEDQDTDNDGTSSRFFEIVDEAPKWVEWRRRDFNIHSETKIKIK